MRRKRFKQIINKNWFPPFLKQNICEFLDWFVIKVNATKPFIPLIEEGLTYTTNKNIINIDFGLGAGIKTVKTFLDESISIESLKIDEFNTEKKGLYICVNSFHQLSSKDAKQLLTQMAKSGNPIVVLEGNNDSLWQIVGMIFFVPLSVLIMSPFVKPFCWSRILFTYLIPILPLVIMIDGCIALLKLYNPKDLEELTSDVIIENYKWEYGKRDNGRGGKVIYLIGFHTVNF